MTERDMMRAAACVKVPGAARRFRAAQPSHSDDPCKASELIGLDTPCYSLSLRPLDGALML
ncbi:hypothetical protein C6Q13_35745 [Burkholderia gladioli]|nr:hypothetical protein [Burkholderia gladioli]PRE77023.1 hypothetical protein C6Q13_35745 [Burkholderia gladioli]RQU89491.1 hypothetical protein DF040_19940 [Burkholderia cenocepacia]